jgi:hypothetical protein
MNPIDTDPIFLANFPKIIPPTSSPIESTAYNNK